MADFHGFYAFMLVSLQETSGMQLSLEIDFCMFLLQESVLFFFSPSELWTSHILGVTAIVCWFGGCLIRDGCGFCLENPWKTL